jgi:hypothetical protein
MDSARVHEMVINLACRALEVLDEENDNDRRAAELLRASRTRRHLMAQRGSWWREGLPNACRLRLQGQAELKDALDAVGEFCDLIVRDAIFAVRRHGDDHEALAKDVAEHIKDWTRVFCGLPRGPRTQTATDEPDEIRADDEPDILDVEGRPIKPCPPFPVSPAGGCLARSRATMDMWEKLWVRCMPGGHRVGGRRDLTTAWRLLDATASPPTNLTARLPGTSGGPTSGLIRNARATFDLTSRDGAIR